MAMVKICDGRESLYRYDTNVRLELCECDPVVECHFVTKEGVIKRELTDSFCEVPDEALTQAGALVIYAFLRDSAGGTTRHEFQLLVKDRPKPADYIDPPDESEAIDLIAERVAQLIGPGGDGSSGGVKFVTDETLALVDGILSVNTADEVEPDNTLPVTSAAVYTEVGNINALLETI